MDRYVSIYRYIIPSPEDCTPPKRSQTGGFIPYQAIHGRPPEMPPTLLTDATEDPVSTLGKRSPGVGNWRFIGFFHGKIFTGNATKS